MHQITFAFLALWRIISVVTEAIVKVQEHCSQWFFSQSQEFYGDQWQTLWVVGGEGQMTVWKSRILLNRSFSVSKYFLCILIYDWPTSIKSSSIQDKFVCPYFLLLISHKPCSLPNLITDLLLLLLKKPTATQFSYIECGCNTFLRNF